MDKIKILKQKFFKILVILFIQILFLPQNLFSKTALDYLSDMSIEDLMDLHVSSAGFFDIPKTEAPGSIWIVDEDDLNQTPAYNLKDILNQEVPGVIVSTHGIFVSLYSSRGVPMFDNSTSQFMHDGINLNSAGSMGVNASLTSTLLGDISKIEISSAPSGTINGNGALNGYINLVPKKGSTHPGAYVNTLYGVKEGLFKTETGFGHVYGVSKDLYLYAGIEGAKGFNPENDLGYSKYSYNDDEINDKFLVNKKDWYNYKASANWTHNRFKLNVLAQNENTSSNAFLSNSKVYSPQIYFNTVIAAPGIEIPFTENESLKVKVPVSFFDWGYKSFFDKDTYIKSKERGVSDVRVEPSLLFKTTSLKNHKIAAGVRFCYVHYRSNDYYFKSVPDSTPMDDTVDWREYSTFVEDIIKIYPWWILTAGVRFDKIVYDLGGANAALNKYVNDAGVWSPRIASSFKIGDNSILKLSYQEGFHFPPATEISGNEHRPEEIKSYEINFLQKFPTYGLDLTLNTFFNEYDDSLLIATESFALNDGLKFGSYGGELIADLKLSETFKYLFSYSFSRPLDLSKDVKGVSTTDKDIKHWTCYPEHIIKNRLTKYFLNKKLMTSLTMQYSSAVKTSDLYSGFEPRDIFKKDRYSFSFKGEYKLRDNFYLNCTVKNIAHNNVTIPNYTYYMPWESNMGENETYFYLGFSWH